MRLAGIPKMEKSFEQPSSKTLNVGAPTFSAVATARGSSIPPSSPFVMVDLKIGSSSVFVRHLVGLKSGHYTNHSCDPAVAR
jgi:hypothetical protein